MTDTWKRRGNAVVGVAGLVVAMSLREELSSVVLRALAAGLGMMFFSVALYQVTQRR